MLGMQPDAIPFSLQAMARDLKTSRKLTLENIADDLGIEGDQKRKATYVIRMMEKNESVSWKFADWILNNYFSPSYPFEFGYHRLRQAGVEENTIDAIKSMVHLALKNAPGVPPAATVAANIIKPVIPPRAKKKLQIESDFDNGTAAFQLREDAVVYPQRKTKTVDRRDELFVYNLFQHAADAQPLRGYSGLAAGPGRELERCDEILYVRELRAGSGHCYAKVHGDSMMATILPGDTIVLQEFENPPTLPAMDPKDNADPDEKQTTSIHKIRPDVADESIWIVQINDNEPTLKRIRYQAKSPHDWKMLIEADNNDAWKSYIVEKTDSVRFWAKFKGLASISANAS